MNLTTHPLVHSSTGWLVHKSLRITIKKNEKSIKIFVARLLASHGLQKLEGFEQMSGSFPDPLGLGSGLSLLLAIFGELVCSLALVVGVLSRLVLLPMIFTMCVAFFMAHGGSMAEGELAFVYLVVFVLLFFAGPGHFSVDGWLAKKLGGQAAN